MSETQSRGLIVLVDDNETGRTVLRHSLRAFERIGIDIEETSSVLETLELLDDDPDVVAVIVNVTADDNDRQDGFDLIDTIIRRPERPAVIVVSESDDHNLVVEAMRRGADDFLLRQNSGRLTAAVRTAVDRAALRNDLSATRRHLTRFHRLVDQTDDVLLIVDIDDQRIIHANRSARSALSMHGPGGPLADVLEGTDPAWRVISELTQSPSLAPRHLEVEVQEQGELRPYSLRSTLMREADGTFLVVVGRDIAVERALEQRLRSAAHRDPLTGLANRRKLDEALAEAIDRSIIESVHLLYCDLDDFKPVNDRFGHVVGDDVLTRTAARIRSACRLQGDESSRPLDLVARIGGDEFVVITSAPNPEIVADRIRAAVTMDHVVDGVAFRVGISVGWTEIRPGDSPSDVLTRADVKVYEDKRRSG